MEAVFETTREQEPVQQHGQDEEVKRMGGDRVLWDAMEEARVKKVLPVLKSYERLELLA